MCIFVPLPPRVGGSGRGCVGERLANAFENRFSVTQDVVVPQSENTKPLAFQPPGAGRVAIDLHGILTAIHLDNQFLGVTHEVDDVGTNGCLATEPQSFQLPPTQEFSQPTLGFGRVNTEASRSGRCHTAILERRPSRGCLLAPTLRHRGGLMVLSLALLLSSNAAIYQIPAIRIS